MFYLRKLLFISSPYSIFHGRKHVRIDSVGHSKCHYLSITCTIVHPSSICQEISNDSNRRLDVIHLNRRPSLVHSHFLRTICLAFDFSSLSFCFRLIKWKFDDLFKSKGAYDAYDEYLMCILYLYIVCRRTATIRWMKRISILYV